MTENAVVVGAGVVGLATAYRLARDRLAVTVVNVAHSRGRASVNNAGWIVRIMSTTVLAPETGTGAAVDGTKVDQSGGHDWRGELAKNGSKYLRWALVEAATQAACHPNSGTATSASRLAWAASAGRRSTASTSPQARRGDLLHAHHQQALAPAGAPRRPLAAWTAHD